MVLYQLSNNKNAPVIPITGAKKLRGTTQIYSFICSLNAAIRQPYTANRLAFRLDTPKRTSASFRVRSLQPPTSLSKTLPHAYLLVHRASRGRFNLMLIIARFEEKIKRGKGYLYCLFQTL